MLALWIKTIAPRSCCGSYDSDDEEYGDYMFARSGIRQPLLKHGLDAARPTSVTVQGVPYRSVPSTTRQSGII